MKFNNLKVEQLEDFFTVVDSCTGNVYLECDDMKLNLKSKIIQYFYLATLFASGNECIDELVIYADNSEDTMKLINFMMSGAK